MKKVFLLIMVMCLITFIAIGQQDNDDYQTINIRHKYYTTEFDTTLLFPIVVKFWLTQSMLSCSEPFERTDNYALDPELPDYTDLAYYYKYSGYDKGHNMDAKDNECDIDGMNESFYYSNMTPQIHALNGGKWRVLEDYCRDLALSHDSILIWCGSIPGHTKIGIITVPSYCWKILYIKSLDSLDAYLMPNKKKLEGTFIDYQINVDLLQNLTGIEFVKNER